MKDDGFIYVIPICSSLILIDCCKTITDEVDENSEITFFYVEDNLKDCLSRASQLFTKNKIHPISHIYSFPKVVGAYWYVCEVLKKHRIQVFH